MSRTEIFLQVREKGLLRCPHPMRATHKDRSKYCRFHRDYDHDTEDCHDLRNQIEELIQKGHLGPYLEEPREETPHPRGPVERQINVISGGPAANGSISTTRKAYSRSTVEKCPQPELEPEITFRAGEVERSHHDDALVISIRIVNARVKRVMVDTESSTDVLYLDTFRRLGLTKEDLTPMASALTRFTRDSISPLGTTILPITIGEEPRAKTMITTFMVVDLPSAYNVILGRPMLNKLKAVVSTYHRVVKFPTPAGIEESRKVAQHRLNIDPEARPVRQKPRKFAPDRQKAISEEVGRLKRAGFITDVQYPRWLSNEVLIKKSNGSWRICLDYTDLNQACPKDCYLLPKIDQLDDATIGHELLAFMDAFSGYNQIQMVTQDRESTAFITNRGAYCYKVMPFVLKNAGATYQSMVEKLFKHQLGKNMEGYVDDMIMKSKAASTHLTDLAETF
uniref:Reverse transcriptase domain-containing protein n=1 Tax=Musa acuminata subsp. malaccensis TaxID=214687 RepID=A0A804ID59_MUSAM|nr:PREDICTED: uncharacterized protein LOC103978443 [Musa acuminata subsp. malaccensis]